MKKQITTVDPFPKEPLPIGQNLKQPTPIDSITIEELVNELFRNAPRAIPRKMLSEITGGTISVKYLANLDSEGLGIQPRIRIGNKVAYPKDAAIAWLKNRCDFF